MYMKQTICLSVLLFLIVSCSNNRGRNENHSMDEEIQVEVKEQTIELADIFKEMNYTLLDSDDSFLIGDIEKTKVVNDNIFILSSKRVLVFDKNTGEAKYSFKKTGSGPDEYISAYDIFVDDSNQIIEILDMNAEKINKYTYNGDHVENIKIPFKAFNFEKIDAENYFFYISNLKSDVSDKQLIRYNTEKGTIESAFLPINNHLASYFFVIERNTFNRLTNHYTFFNCPNHICYSLSGDRIKSEYKITFGKNTVPEDFYTKDFNDIAHFAKEANENGYVYFINSFFEKEDGIIFSFRYREDNYWSIYDKLDKSVITGNYISDGNHFKNKRIKLEYQNIPCAVDSESFYFLIQPEQFMKMAGEYGVDTIPGDGRVEESIIKILTNPEFGELSNPILVTCKFKS